jgi:hypothetical protein
VNFILAQEDGKAITIQQVADTVQLAATLIAIAQSISAIGWDATVEKLEAFEFRKLLEDEKP